ncbi:promethin-B-like [Chanos chanos]|uniref:Promethin-B-like n=1 Tax=Chanos chanos TaxID=29144 RepID=A0A6J2WS76_CHACN|nr:promethin [Chanos chanos]
MELQARFRPLMERLHNDPKVSELLNTTVGRYLTDHPFLALTALVFGGMAIIPVGLFLVYATIIFIAGVVCLTFFEVFLLATGGLTLLFVLGGIAVAALLVSCVLSVLYITISNLHNYYSNHRLPQKGNLMGRMGSKKSKIY